MLPEFKELVGEVFTGIDLPGEVREGDEKAAAAVVGPTRGCFADVGERPSSVAAGLLDGEAAAAAVSDCDEEDCLVLDVDLCLPFAEALLGSGGWVSVRGVEAAELVLPERGDPVEDAGVDEDADADAAPCCDDSALVRLFFIEEDDQTDVGRE